MNLSRIKLYRTLASLEPVELLKFERFVASPYFHQHEATRQYFDLLKQAYPDFEEDSIDAKQIFAQIYPAEPFDDNKIRTLRKYLLRLLYQFLSLTASEKERGYENHFLLQSLLDRNLVGDYIREAEQIQQELEQQELRDESYFQERFYLQRLDMHFSVYHQSRLQPMAFLQMNQQLDDAFVIQKLELACAELNRKRLSGEALFQNPFLPIVISHCQQAGDQLVALARAYYLCFLLLRRTLESNTLEQLEDILSSVGIQEFSLNHRTNLYSHAINYCNDQYRAGKVIYLERMFRLYQQMLVQGLLFEKGQLSTHQYKNMTTLGLRLGEWDWTIQFVEENKDRIETKYRNGVYHYNKAHIDLYQKEFSHALKHLQQVEFIDPFYRISYQMLLLKIFYECKETEPLLALAQTFRTFIRRKKNLADKQKLAYTNFARFVRASFMIRIGKKKNLSALKNSIDESDALIERQWLQAKVAELEDIVSEN